MVKRYIRSYLPLISLVFGAFMLAGCQNEDGNDHGLTDVVKVGDAVPDFMLAGDGEETLTSSSLKSQVYMLSFFDTGCRDCQEELPVLQRIYDKYKETVTVLNVPRSQTIEEARRYWGQTGLSMPIYEPLDKNLYYKFAVRGIPRIYIVRDGVVEAVFTDSPLADFETLDTVLQNLTEGDAVTDKSTVELSFRLKVMSGTRGSETFFQNEYAISHIEFFFFDAATKKYVTKVAIENLTRDENPYNTQYDITYILQAVKVKVGLYNIFAIANYEGVPDNITDQDEFLNLTDTITYRSGVEASLPYTGPVMTNRATSLLSVNLVPWAGKKCFLQVEMERVMAKLQIGIAHNNFMLKHNNRKYADVNITNYKLVNLNKQYYLFQHKSVMNTLGEMPNYVLPDNFDDYGEGNDEYVIDPLFFKKTSSLTDANKFRNYYESWYGAFSTENFASIPTAGNYGNAYILENTSYKSSQKLGYSPGIVFKAAVSPVFVYLFNNQTRTLVEEYRAEYWPHTIYMYNFNFYGSIQAINIASGLTLDELESYSDAQLKNYGIKKCEFNMGVYETYYTYWIRHRNTTSNPMDAMNYGVVRNNYYKIVVAGVSGIGNSVIIPEIMRDNYPNSYADIAVSEN